MHMSIFILLFLGGSAFVAGLIDTIAGGGGLEAAMQAQVEQGVALELLREAQCLSTSELYSVRQR